MRSLLAAVAALLVLAVPIAVPAKPAKVSIHQLTPAPGFSVALPDGWMACDPASNIALHNAPQIIAIEKLCASIREHQLKGFETHVFVDSDPSIKLMMWSFFTTEYIIPDEYFAKATPQLLQEEKDVFCEAMKHAGVPVGECTLHETTFGNRPAFLGDTGPREFGSHKFVGKLYLLSGRTGTMMFAFAAELPLNAKVQQVMDEVAATMHADPVAQPAPAQLVALTPVPGIAVSVPKGWASCDGATNTLLGDQPDPHDLKKVMCGSPEDGSIRVFDPHPPYLEAVDIQADAGDPETMARRMAPEQIAHDRDEDCELLSDPLIKRGFKLTDCQSAQATIGGQLAKIVTFFATGKPDQTAFTTNVIVRSMFVPVGGQLYLISISSGSALTPAIDATGEAVISSIAFR